MDAADGTGLEEHKMPGALATTLFILAVFTMAAALPVGLIIGMVSRSAAR
jgi:hypothetical protein